MLTAQIAGLSEWEARHLGSLMTARALFFTADQVLSPLCAPRSLSKSRAFLKSLWLQDLPGSSCSGEQISSKRTKLNMRQSINKNQASLPPPLYLQAMISPLGVDYKGGSSSFRKAHSLTLILLLFIRLTPSHKAQQLCHLSAHF